MIFAISSLIVLGFLVGLSGAVIPGPLLAFTVFDTAKRGRVTGHWIIVGHAVWEFVIILLILSGFGWIITQYTTVFYIIGGLILILMGLGMIRRRGGEVVMQSSKVNSSLLGGLFYTAFNPTQPPWWATAGLVLLLKGIELMGLMGVALVTVGHWLSDFAYYILVSFAVHKYGRYINPHQRKISVFLGIFIAVLGIYFLTQGLTSFLR